MVPESALSHQATSHLIRADVTDFVDEIANGTIRFQVVKASESQAEWLLPMLGMKHTAKVESIVAM